uniref:Uncharacterized protein n=1 Tax=Noccaea caerulescens TaxID=107243 RepID=A0A1J3GAV8_NOCCA
MVEEKHLRLVDEVKELRKKVVKILDFQTSLTRKMEEEVKEKVEEKIKEEVMMATETMQKMARERLLIGQSLL